MKIVKTYFKNSISGDIIYKTEFTETKIKGIPIYYYRDNLDIGDPDLSGYIEISEKKYKSLTKKNKKHGRIKRN